MYCSEGVYLGENLSWDSADQSEYREVDAGVYVRRLGKAGSCLGVDLVERTEMVGDPEWKEARSLSLGGVAGDKGSDARTGVEGTARESDREAVGKESGTVGASWSSTDEGPAVTTSTAAQVVFETAESIWVTTAALKKK